MGNKMKIIKPLALIILVIMFSGCGNRDVSLNSTYTHALVKFGNETREYRVRSWDFRNSGLLEITTIDEVTFLTHSSNVILSTQPIKLTQEGVSK